VTADHAPGRFARRNDPDPFPADEAVFPDGLGERIGPPPRRDHRRRRGPGVRRSKTAPPTNPNIVSVAGSVTPVILSTPIG